jgi:hypothetical protein
VAASQVFSRLELDSIQILAASFFPVSRARLLIDYRARKHQEVEVMKRIYFGAIPVPWISLGFFSTESWTLAPHSGTCNRRRKAAILFLQPASLLLLANGTALEHIAVENDFDRSRREKHCHSAQKGAAGIPGFLSFSPILNSRG